MKITMYELLGLILDDDAPGKIKYKNNIYQYDGETQNYYKSLNFTKDWLIGEDITAMLDDGVEIIEEPKKIKRLDIDFKKFDDEIVYLEFESKINELIDEINNLKEE